VSGRGDVCVCMEMDDGMGETCRVDGVCYRSVYAVWLGGGLIY